MNELSQNATQQMLNIEELNTGISNAVFFFARFFLCFCFCFLFLFFTANSWPLLARNTVSLPFT